MLMLPGDVFQFTLFWDSMEKHHDKSHYVRYICKRGDIIVILKADVFEFAKNFNQHVLFMCNGYYHQIEFFTPESVKLEILIQRTKKLNNDDKL